jgi:hypothetical protein
LTEADENFTIASGTASTETIVDNDGYCGNVSDASAIRRDLM